MGLIQRDLEERASEKAEEMAEQRCGRPFSDLPASVQMTVWMDAEQEAKDELADQADFIYDQMREKGHQPTRLGRL